jgi:tRNA threonylcarbamoyl adenosine modification protein YeaZ
MILRLAQLELRQLDALAAVAGPGSFTGLRVGLAAVKGLAFSLRKPAIGMSALDLLALSAGFSGKVLSIINAGRGEVYAGLRELNGQGVFWRVGADQVGRAPSVLQSLLPLIGSGPLVLTGEGAMHYQVEIAGVAQSLGLPVRVTRLIDPRFDGWQIKTVTPPLAPELARQMSPLLAAGTALQAYYLRPADAELKAKDVTVR